MLHKQQILHKNADQFCSEGCMSEVAIGGTYCPSGYAQMGTKNRKMDTIEGRL